MNPEKRVCVIGAGPAGLCAGRHMKNSPEKYTFIIFEQSDLIGGTWNVQEVKDPQLPIHSSMYKSLKTIIPKEIMGYPDYPFPESVDSFVHHSSVLEYVKNYAKSHNLYDVIKFKTQVNSISPETHDGRVIWKVETIDIETKSVSSYDFDSVMVCNGHYTVPNIPEIADIENYVGEKTHSHYYREPTPFAGKVVIVLGAATSGLDIAIELASVSPQVYLSHNRPSKYECEMPKNLMQVSGIHAANAEGFILRDGTYVQADVLLYCTGYKFEFQFLSEKCKVRIENNRVRLLYNHIIHMDFPTLCFIGLPCTLLTFTMFHFQVQYFLKALDGAMDLPKRNEMEREEEEDFCKRVVELKMPAKYAHKMATLQWDYFNKLAINANFTPLPLVYRMIFDKVEDERRGNAMKYKRDHYHILDHDQFQWFKNSC